VLKERTSLLIPISVFFVNSIYAGIINSLSHSRTLSNLFPPSISITLPFSLRINRRWQFASSATLSSQLPAIMARPKYSHSSTNPKSRTLPIAKRLSLEVCLDRGRVWGPMGNYEHPPTPSLGGTVALWNPFGTRRRQNTKNHFSWGSSAIKKISTGEYSNQAEK